MLRGTSQVNEQGHLEIGGVDTVNLVEKYGTPLFVYDVALVKEKANLFLNTLRQLRTKGKAFYASKAFTSVAMSQLLDREGMNFDVVSGGELYTVLSAGVDPKKILFHGNNKTPEEIKMALTHQIGTIVVDSDYEIQLIEHFAEELNCQATVLLRVKPGVEVYTHKYTITGQEDSKFGFDMNNGDASHALVRMLENKRIDVKGVHSHIGSQIFGADGFLIALERVFEKLQEWKQRFDYVPEVLNIGGGFGIQYTRHDQPQPIQKYLSHIIEKFHNYCSRYQIPTPELWIEPGRSVVGEAGTTLYTVGSRKEITNIRTFISVDGGMSDNIRPALYQSKYEAELANRMHDEKTETVTIAGKCCETGDLLIENTELPHCEAGDTLAMFCTGAYGYSMASNYNKLSRPAVVFVENGKDQLVIKRETKESLIQNDIPLFSTVKPL